MPELLLELFSEEIPARMQRKAADDLKRLVTDALVAAGLTYEGAKAFATPRRLALTITGVPAHSAPSREEKKGPKVGAPEQAVQGFLRSAGLASLDQAVIQSDPKKGDFYVAVIEKHGRHTTDILAEAIPGIIRAFPWPKSMHWGSGRLTWVRPLQSILCTFGPETEDPEIVHFAVDGIASSNVTRGHRFLAPEEFTVRRFEDYADKLEKAKVVLDADRRKDIILHDARDRALALGLELVEDEGLLEEVAGLVEWPVVLTGTFEEDFLAIPPEVIRATIRANQKCFVLRQPGSSALANRFVLVSNIEAIDGGAAISAGNGRVIRARLSDAKFFYDTDKSATLESRLPKFDAIVFHDKLGSQSERIERIVQLAGEIAPPVGADIALAQEAARLAKLDLVTEMVGEFPELQGLMGRYYAAAEGKDKRVAAAIEEHYKPQGPGDRVPTDPVSIAVALADKLDTLTGFWAIDEKPTGSKDPFALRRAALGVIRIVLENGLRLRLEGLMGSALVLLLHESFRTQDRYVFMSAEYEPEYGEAPKPHWSDAPFSWLLNADGFLDQRGGAAADYQAGNPDLTDEEDLFAERRKSFQELQNRLETLDSVSMSFWFDNLDDPDEPALTRANKIASEHPWLRAAISAKADDLLAFFHDRLKVQLRDSGARHDLVDAVLSAGTVAGRPSLPAGGRDGEGVLAAATTASAGTPPPRPSPLRGEGESNDDLLDIVRRVEALGAFLASEDGRNLLAGYRRAANILKAEEKGGERFEGDVEPALFQQAEEAALAEAIAIALPAAAAAADREDYAGAMAALAALRGPVDAFFEKVLVNAEDEAVRANRLRLLAAIRQATRAVADFSKIGG